jgi:hypothetical protein
MVRSGFGAWSIGTIRSVQESSSYGVFAEILFCQLGLVMVSASDKLLFYGNVDAVLT